MVRLNRFAPTILLLLFFVHFHCYAESPQEFDSPLAQKIYQITLQSTRENAQKAFKQGIQEPILINSMSDDPNLRFQAFSMATNRIDAYLRYQYLESNEEQFWEDFLKDALRLKPFSDVVKEDVQTRLAYRYHQVPSKMLEGTSGKAKYLCGPGYRIGCIHAVEDAMKLMRPVDVDGFAVSMLASWEKVMTDVVYTKAAVRLAQKIVERSHRAITGKGVEGNLLDDAKIALTQSDPRYAHKPASLLRASILLLGIGATRGVGISEMFNQLAKTGDHFMEAAQVPLMSSLFIIAAGASYLDSVTVKSGRPYSLPSGITSHCDYGRAYHFWISPLLVRSLVERGHNAQDSMEAVHRLGFAYELMAPVNRPDDLNPLWPRYYYHTEIQKDVYFTGLGAFWGAAVTQDPHHLPNVDADIQFSKMLRPREKADHKVADEFLFLGPRFLSVFTRHLPFVKEVLDWTNTIHPFTLLPTWKKDLIKHKVNCSKTLENI